jgi:hypothetical protein
MTGLNPNFTAIDGVMYDNETRSTQALNKANVNEQNIATALGRITTAEGDIDTLESGLQTANTNISGLTSRMNTAESGLVSANNRIQENAGEISQLRSDLDEKSSEILLATHTGSVGEIDKTIENLSRFKSISVIVINNNNISASTMVPVSAFKNCDWLQANFFNVNTRLFSEVKYISDTAIKVYVNNANLTVNVYGII